MSSSTVTLTAPDIECDGCAASIGKALGREAGVQTVAVAIPEKTVSIVYDAAMTNPTVLAEALSEIGFPVTGY